MNQTSLLPELVPEHDELKKVCPRIKKSMHNIKIFRSLLIQLEKQQTKEMNRLTDGATYKIFSFVGLLPRKKNKRWGYFLKNS